VFVLFSYNETYGIITLQSLPKIKIGNSSLCKKKKYYGFLIKKKMERRVSIQLFLGEFIYN
jgi:hypothetical protein